MKLLIIAPHIKIPGLSGAAIHHTEFSKALSKLGTEVHILADSGKNLKLEGKIFVHPSKVSSVAPRRFLTSLLSVNTAVRICKKNNINIIHDRCDPGQIAGYLTSKFLGLPRVCEVNENQLAYEIKGSFIRDVLAYPFLILIKILWIKNIIADSNFITTVSNTIRKALIKGGIAPKKIVSISNGTYPNFSGKRLSLKRFGIKKDDIVATIVGELGPRQGIMEFVQSFNLIGIPNFKLILVGSEERYKKYLNKVKDFVNKNNLGEKIIFIEKIPHNKIKKFLAATDFALAPYRESWNKESFGFCPLKILDYMAAGKVVITTNTEWIKELIEDRKNGFLVPFESFSRDMEKIIKKLDRKTRERIENNARKEILKKFTWDHVAKKYLKVYKTLLRK